MEARTESGLAHDSHLHELNITPRRYPPKILTSALHYEEYLHRYWNVSDQLPASASLSVGKSACAYSVGRSGPQSTSGPNEEGEYFFELHRFSSQRAWVVSYC
jgi:hypothetical protein